MEEYSEERSTTKLWGGRFSGDTHPIMDALNASISYDRRLYEVDIRGSQAYAKALLKVNILTDSECKLIVEGLGKVKEEWKSGKFKVLPQDEDIHTANERRLNEIIGSEIGGKLHTGRSRNDQVATDMRLWLREACQNLIKVTQDLVAKIVSRAEDDSDVLIPGYTHLQRAQPIRWSHFLLSYGWRFKADCDRLHQILHRVNQLPLGSGALAGNPFNIDRKFLADELGFEGIIMNSLVGVADRDFVMEFLFWASLISLHISQLAEDLITYSTAEFNFIILAEAFTTGSSLMPQKKNPDSLELLRGKSGRVFGKLAGFMMTMKGLPSSYNKDMQEDKEPMFDAYDTTIQTIQLTATIIHTLSINPMSMQNALSEDMLATDMADYLVRKGVPFRETHHVVGQAVLRSEEQEVSITQLPLDTLKELHTSFDDDVKLLGNDYEGSVEKRQSLGGTSLAQVKHQIELLKQWAKQE